MNPFTVVAQFLRQRVRKYLQAIDREHIGFFQTWVYYPCVLSAGLYLLVGADDPTEALEDTLGTRAYMSWLALNIACPVFALWGRRVWEYSHHHHLPSRCRLAAGLMLIGDGGIFGAILVYVGCLINTVYWGQALYPTFFFLMSIPTGFNFTFRSWRRLRQLDRL